MEKDIQAVVIDLNDTPIIMKAVTALVNMNTDVPAEYNALMVAAGEGTFVPIIIQLFANSN
jgi:hypothetical protein